MELGAQNPIDKLPDNICVVIIGRNEGKRLENCIKSVFAAGAKRIVYVDSQSRDGSVKLAAEYGVSVIKLGSEKPLNAARARNAGIASLMDSGADIDYVHFIDGDCELDSKWLIKAIETLENLNDVAVVCGRLREKYRDQTLYNRLCDMAWYLPVGEINSCGGIATMRASAFLENKGFNEKLIAGEEPEFYRRLRLAGYKIRSLKDNMGTHDAAMTSYSEWWTRSVRTGFSYANAKEWNWRNNQRRSLVIWGGIYPLMLIVSCFVNPAVTLVGILIFPVQIYRVFRKLDIPYSKKERLLYACFCMLDKFPEFLGFLKYQYAKITRRDHEIIEYKD